MPRTITPCSSGYDTVQDEGVALTQRRIIDFAGAGVTATDDAANARTLVTIPGSSSGGGDGCRVYNSTAISIPNATNQVLSAFDTELWDVGGMHDVFTNPERITVKTTGKYLVGGNVYHDTNATGYRGVMIYQQSLGGFIGLEHAASSGAVVGTGLNVSAIASAVVGDWFELWVRQTSGGPLNVLAQQFYSPQFWAQQLA